MTKARRVVVVGTGTDIGKTHVVSCLLAYGKENGARVRGFKPVATGVDPVCEDAERHAASSGAAVVPPTFAYLKPVSPHLAAREEGRPIDLAAVRRAADTLSAFCDVLVVEGAGGLFSPLSETLTNADLARELAPAHVVLVASDRLGVLHDVRSTLMAARAFGLRVDTVVLSEPSRADSSTGTNAQELETLDVAKVAGVFPRALTTADESRAAAARLWARIVDSGAPG